MGIPLNNNFWMPEPISMKLGMCIMAQEHISTACFTNPSHWRHHLHSLSNCWAALRREQCDMMPQSQNNGTKRWLVAMQHLSKHVPMARYTCNNRKSVGCRKIWSWVLLGPEPRMPVLVRVSSNLPKNWSQSVCHESWDPASGLLWAWNQRNQLLNLQCKGGRRLVLPGTSFLFF
jgi:hypothetical protein